MKKIILQEKLRKILDFDEAGAVVSQSCLSGLDLIEITLSSSVAPFVTKIV